MRNPGKAVQGSGGQAAQDQAVNNATGEDDEDNYSDEEIANDPEDDDDDDGTNQLMNVRQLEDLQGTSE